MSIGRCSHGGCVRGSVLPLTARTLHLLPLVAVQVFEVAVVPLHRVGGPCALEPGGDRVGAFARAKAVLPAEALLLYAGALRFTADVLGIRGSAMCFPECVSAGNERDGLLVIHRHAAEGFSNV